MPHSFHSLDLITEIVNKVVVVVVVVVIIIIIIIIIAVVSFWQELSKNSTYV
jgi:hypothetical protein